jgi:hypothetical protein
MHILLFLIPFAVSKSVLLDLKFTSEKPWQEISRFGLGLGEGNFSVTARFKEPSQEKNLKMNMVLYSGLKWTDQLTKLSCEERVSQSSSKYEISLPSSSKWSKRTGGRLIQKQSPQVFYFVLADCSGLLNGKEIQVDFTVVNHGFNHFSVELVGIKNSFAVALALLLAIFGKNVIDFARVWKNDEGITGPRIWLNVAIILQIVATASQFVHLTVYEIDGKGFWVFDLISEVSTLFYELAISTLLVIVASGWTINYTKFPRPQLYLPAILIEALFHLSLVLFNWLYELPRHSFSKYEEWSGVVILILRMLMFAVFLKNLFFTSKQENFKNSTYFYSFGLWASFYFLSIPLLVYGSFMFPTYQREYLVGSLHQLFQIVIFFFLYRILTSKGDLMKLNKILSMLPGARSHIS